MSKLTNILSQVSPFLNAILPGSGLVMNGLLSLFGAKDEDDLASKISADPQALIKLKEFELEIKKLDMGDIANARDRQEKVIEILGKRDWVVDFISIFLVLGFFAIIAMVVFTTTDKTDHDILMLLIGQLSAAFLSVVGFYFGNIKK